MKYRVQCTVHSFRVSVAVLDSLSPLQIRFQSTNQREGGRGKGSGKERGEIGIRRGEKGRTKGGGEGMDERERKIYRRVARTNMYKKRMGEREEGIGYSSSWNLLETMLEKVQ